MVRILDILFLVFNVFVLLMLVFLWRRLVKLGRNYYRRRTVINETFDWHSRRLHHLDCQIDKVQEHITKVREQMQLHDQQHKEMADPETNQKLISKVAKQIRNLS